MNVEVIECFKKAEGKLKILIDENMLDEYLIKFLKKRFSIGKAVKNRGLDDMNVNKLAMKESSVILTSDQHFWDDKIFPMHQTPRIIIITAKDTDETIKTLDTFFNNLYNLFGIARYCNKWWIGTKVKVQKTGFTRKYITDDGSISLDERIEYEL